MGVDKRQGSTSADMRRRVKKHAPLAVFLHGLFGNRYTKDGVVSA
jgi:hypothetical protein